MKTPESIGSRALRIILFASILGSLLASVLAAVTLDILVANQADRRLRAATDTLEIELNEEKEVPEYSLDELLDVENHEIVTSGIRLAVYEGTLLLAGNNRAPVVEPRSCSTRKGMRACGKPYGRWTLIAAQADERNDWRLLLLSAVGVALVFGSLFSFLLSQRAARWVSQPLVQLAKDVEALDGRSSALQHWQNSNVLEVQAVQDSVDALLARLGTLLESSQRFSRDAAHELLTPLAVMSAKIQLLQESECIPASVEEALSELVDRLQRLSKLVDKLLLLANDPESSRGGFEPVSLDESIHEAWRTLDSGEQGRVRIEAPIEGLVLGEPELIRGAISNLLNNALKFSSDDVHVQLKNSRDTLQIHVTDRGPGVPDKLRQRVLEPFYRSSQSNRALGHGLGLAIVAHIMSAHRGSVQFQDTDVGTHVVLTFPRWKSATS